MAKPAATAQLVTEVTEYVPAPGPQDDYEEYRRDLLRARLIAVGEPLFESPGFGPDGVKLPERDILSDLAYEIEWYLRSLSIPQLVCLTYGHRWPELIPVPGMKLPRGFRAVRDPQVRTVFLVTEDCTRKIVIGKGERRRADAQYCGTVRKSRTLPGEISGLFDRSHMRQYTYDNDVWAKRPRQSRLTRIDFLDEIYRRMGRDLFPAEMEEGQ